MTYKLKISALIVQNILEYVLNMENVLKERQHQKCIEQNIVKRIHNSNNTLALR